jgi:LmbE family N-acetylglucosaminyl deacetylase
VPDRLLLVLAHPDDESMATGGVIARHSRAGVHVHLICLTRGGAGWGGRPPGGKKEELPAIRTEELHAAAKVLGLASVELWDYPDGGVPECDQAEIARRIREVAIDLRPAAVVGWGPDGGYFHPDHIACGACTDEALAGTGIPVYHVALTPSTADAYRTLVALSGVDPSQMPLAVWGKTTVTFKLHPDEMSVKKMAIAAHVSQLDEGWDQYLGGKVDISGLEYEGFLRVRDTNPANALLHTGLLPEVSGRP